jgi:hypothetical protein
MRHSLWSICGHKISGSLVLWPQAGLILALALSGCASLYQPHITTIRLADPHKMGGSVADAGSVTTFEQWTSIWSAVCGAVVNYSNGVPAQVIPGNCGTPLTLLLGAPVNVGLASVLVNHPW